MPARPRSSHRARYLLYSGYLQLLHDRVTAFQFTDVTTTQCFDPRANDWARTMLAKLNIPTHMLPDVIPPGTVLGPMKQSLASELGLNPAPVVIAPACHDTGSAVVAVPAHEGARWAYLSSGTWSLMGTEVREPIINSDVLEANFTNEGGVDGTFRFLKNISGLWLLQETQRIWREKKGAITRTTDRRDAEKRSRFVSWWIQKDPSSIPPTNSPTRFARTAARRTSRYPTLRKHSFAASSRASQ